MDVKIRTDSTRDEELEGKVIFIAPASNEMNSANTGMSMSGVSSSKASYLVKIEILTPNDRLKLGMNAKLSIITDKSENALVVPYDAINEKNDGKHYITIIKDDGSREDIEVEIGLESGYYTEVKSDKIAEGMRCNSSKS